MQPLLSCYSCFHATAAPIFFCLIQIWISLDIIIWCCWKLLAKFVFKNKGHRHPFFFSFAYFPIIWYPVSERICLIYRPVTNKYFALIYRARHPFRIGFVILFFHFNFTWKFCSDGCDKHQLTRIFSFPFFCLLFFTSRVFIFYFKNFYIFFLLPIHRNVFNDDEIIDVIITQKEKKTFSYWFVDKNGRVCAVRAFGFLKE